MTDTFSFQNTDIRSIRSRTGVKYNKTLKNKLNSACLRDFLYICSSSTAENIVRPKNQPAPVIQSTTIS